MLAGRHAKSAGPRVSALVRKNNLLPNRQECQTSGGRRLGQWMRAKRRIVYIEKKEDVERMPSRARYMLLRQPAPLFLATVLSDSMK